MQIKKITLAAIQQAADILKKGGAVVYPTDTVYGLGADIFNRQAVERVYKIKKRLPGEPLLVMVDSLAMAKSLAVFNKKREEIFKKLLPGLVSLLLPKKDKVPAWISGPRKTIGLRLPQNKTAINLVGKCGFPITSTSANISGQQPPREARAIYNQFKNKKYQPDLILDAGTLPVSLPSTILDLSGKKVKIIRVGAVSVKKLTEVLKI